MDWIEPVYDRTDEDVKYAKQHPASAPTLKGAINFTDRARIANNIHYLAELLTSYGYPLAAYCKIDWTRDDKPYASTVQIMHDDIERIQTEFYRYKRTPILSWNHYEKINEIERILFEIESTIADVVAAFQHSGTFFSGMEGIRV